MANQKVPDKKPFRFSLRKLLLFMTICAVTCAVLAKLLEMPLVLGGAVGLVAALATWTPFWLLTLAISDEQRPLNCISYSLGSIFLGGLAILVFFYVHGSQPVSFSPDVIAIEIILSLGAVFCLCRAIKIALATKAPDSKPEESQRQ